MRLVKESKIMPFSDGCFELDGDAPAGKKLHSLDFCHSCIPLQRNPSLYLIMWFPSVPERSALRFGRSGFNSTATKKYSNQECILARRLNRHQQQQRVRARARIKCDREAVTGGGLLPASWAAVCMSSE